MSAQYAMRRVCSPYKVPMSFWNLFCVVVMSLHARRVKVFMLAFFEDEGQSPGCVVEGHLQRVVVVGNNRAGSIDVLSFEQDVAGWNRLLGVEFLEVSGAHLRVESLECFHGGVGK